MIPKVIPTSWLRNGISASVSAGTLLIVRNAIKATTPGYTSILDRLLIKAGELAISTYVAAKTYQFVDEQLKIYFPDPPPTNPEES